MLLSHYLIWASACGDAPARRHYARHLVHPLVSPPCDVSGSLLNLAKHPASTVQILGAEKALFRALKTRKDTPKYGLIYHASLVGQTAAKNKGKVRLEGAVVAAVLKLVSRFWLISIYCDILSRSLGCWRRKRPWPSATMRWARTPTPRWEWRTEPSWKPGCASWRREA